MTRMELICRVCGTVVFMSTILVCFVVQFYCFFIEWFDSLTDCALLPYGVATFFYGNTFFDVLRVKIRAVTLVVGDNKTKIPKQLPNLGCATSRTQEEVIPEIGI